MIIMVFVLFRLARRSKPGFGLQLREVVLNMFVTNISFLILLLHRLIVVVGEKNDFVLTYLQLDLRDNKDVDITTDNLPCLTLIFVQGKG